jgi:hypothetical protein
LAPSAVGVVVWIGRGEGTFAGSSRGCARVVCSLCSAPSRDATTIPEPATSATSSNNVRTFGRVVRASQLRAGSALRGTNRSLTPTGMPLSATL